MSNQKKKTGAMKIGKVQKKAKAQMISQSIPANFFKNYAPPKPRIVPLAAPKKMQNSLPKIDALPPISAKASQGIHSKNKQSFSLRDDKHPMSMPSKGFMGGPNAKPFSYIKETDESKDKKDVIMEEEEKKDQQSNIKKMSNMKIGSFTCMQIMGTGNLSSIPDDAQSNKTGTSETASTFHASETEAPEVAEDADEDDDLPFDMDE